MGNQCLDKLDPIEFFETFNWNLNVIDGKTIGSSNGKLFSS